MASLPRLLQLLPTFCYFLSVRLFKFKYKRRFVLSQPQGVLGFWVFWVFGYLGILGILGIVSILGILVIVGILGTLGILCI